MAGNTARGIGDNSKAAEAETDHYATPEHAAVVRQINTELNYHAQERDDLAAQERELKQALKAMGVPPKAITLGRSAAKAKDGAAAMFDEALQFLSNPQFEAQRQKLAEITEARKEISKAERALRESAKSHDVHLESLKLCRRMQQMDPIERQELFDSAVAYVKVFRFW